MLPLEQQAERVLFGCFEVNLRTAEVFRNGRKLRLSGQAARVLVVLLQRAGQLVSREELRDLLWHKETFVDFDQGLNNCVNRIREALGDSAGAPEWIETLPKQGYRFIAPIRLAEHAASRTESTPENTSGSVDVVPAEGINGGGKGSIEVPPARRKRRYAYAILISAIILAAAFGYYKMRSRPDARISDIHVIAVLPVANLSGDSSQEFLSDGITDELITELARNTTLAVISRTSSMRYKNRPSPLPVVARELGVDGVVESSLRRAGDRFTVAARLIAPGTDTQLWTATYEGDLTELSRIPARVALDITAKLIRPTQRQRSQAPRSAISADAYQEYLKGHYLWHALQTESALKHFQRAVEMQPDYAAAYAGIAKIYCRWEYQQVLPPSVAFPAAKAAAEKALDLDPHNSEAHAARGFVYGQQDWDWGRSEEEIRTAIAEDPSNSVGHYWYCYALHQKGRTAEALEQASLAVQADPAYSVLIKNYAAELAYNKRYPEAIARFKDALEFEPNRPDIHFGLSDAYARTGKFEDAADELEKAYNLAGEQDIGGRLREHVKQAGFEKAADWARYEHLQRELDRLNKKAALGEYVSPSAYVYAYAGLRDKENTLRWLEAAYAGDSHVMVELRNEMFDFVRQEPRFQKIWQNVPFSH
jgi:TolB-like protein/DNA-binding winged helix-turn-helix (wHTH) protein/Tfp pilus assembly protein PilF